MKNKCCEETSIKLECAQDGRNLLLKELEEARKERNEAISRSGKSIAENLILKVALEEAYRRGFKDGLIATNKYEK